MRFSLPLAVVLLVVSTGCPNYVPYLPDGGRARVNCADSTIRVPVTVVDKAGAPVPQAVVALEYLSYGENENVIANERGVALVKEQYGPGVVRAQGFVNDLRTQFAEITFNGSVCSSSASPNALTLQLQ
jgi:hypothetical protein